MFIEIHGRLEGRNRNRKVGTRNGRVRGWASLAATRACLVGAMQTKGAMKDRGGALSFMAAVSPRIGAKAMVPILFPRFAGEPSPAAGGCGDYTT